MSIFYNKNKEQYIINKFNIRNKDGLRRKIFSYLKKNSLTINQKKCIEFHKYITEETQEELFCTYITILLGGYDEKLAFQLLNEILVSYKKRSGIYTFKELFNINIDWYDYYGINAYIDGKLKGDETRKGVDKNYVDDVMLIKNMIEAHLNNVIELEKAIIICQNIKTKGFLIGD